MANRRQREKRRARRQAAAGQVATVRSTLAPHTQRCPCAECEEKRKHTLRRGITQTEKRLREYSPAHPQPEHRDDPQWRISGHRLVEFFETHYTTRDPKGKTCRVEMRPEWLAHLDSLVLGQALAHMQECRPYWAWLIVCCVVDGHTQSAVADWLGVNRLTICRQLRDGLHYLHALIADQAAAVPAQCAPAQDGEPVLVQ